MLTTDGKVKVMDFGIARASAVPSITQTSAVVGTAQYIAPEQAQGLEVDARSDVYALGCCLYEMVTGQVPFTGPTPVAIAYRHVREDPTPPRALNPDVPVPLEQVILKAMAKRPEDRYQTAVELQRDLERVRVGEPVTVAGPLPSQQTTQAIGAAGYGEAATSLLGAGGTVAGTRAARYAEGVPEQRRGSLGWVLAAILALVVVGLAAFFITRAVTSPSTSPGTTVTTPTTPPTSAPTTTEPTTTEPTTTSHPTTTRPPTTTKPPTTTEPPTTQPPTTPTTRPPTTATTKGITTTSG
jgi:eukaryotic-like serine/threonine-protein kinase